jgi:hypothetical protein
MKRGKGRNMIDEKKVSEAGRPLPQVPGSGEEERLRAIDKAAMGGLATPNEMPQRAGDEAASQKPAGQTSAAVKREAGQTLGRTPTMSEKMEQRQSATTGGTDADEVSARPRQQQDETAKDGAASSGEMVEKVVEQTGLSKGPRRGS